jgi:hypothetical protein
MKHSTLKPDVFAAEQHCTSVGALGDPLVLLVRHMDFFSLAAEMDRTAHGPPAQRADARPIPRT